MARRRSGPLSAILAVVMVSVALTAVCAPPAVAGDATCDCIELGPFVEPKVAEPYVPSGIDGLSAATGARYRLTAASRPSGHSW